MGRPLICEVGAKNVFYGYDGKLCGVEQLALQYYAEEGGGWRGIHSESGIWMTIFGLLMWDVLFADFPDVFRSKFQVKFQGSQAFLIRLVNVDCVAVEISNFEIREV